MLLEWPEHSSQILRGVNSLKAFYDVTLSAEGQEIKAHRVILAAASTYFNELLSTESQTEDRFPIVFLKDVKFCDLEAIIKFIYTGKTQVSATNLSSCTDLAKTLGVSGFTQKLIKSPQKSSDSTKDFRSSPQKRKSSDFNKENLVKWSASEPIVSTQNANQDLNEPVYQNLQNLKRRKIHSLDNVCDTFVSPPHPFQSTIVKSTSPIKRSNLRTASCPAPAESPAGGTPVKAGPAFPQATMLNNFSFDSTFSSMNAANILQTLALWMMEDQKVENQGKNLTNPPPPAPPNSLKSNPSSTSRGRKHGESEADRPDSGFDSKDEEEVKLASLHTAQVSEAISEEAGIRTASSGDTSPDVSVEISRQAPIRQPVFRKRRLHQ